MKIRRSLSLLLAFAMIITSIAMLPMAGFAAVGGSSTITSGLNNTFSNIVISSTGTPGEYKVEFTCTQDNYNRPTYWAVVSGECVTTYDLGTYLATYTGTDFITQALGISLGSADSDEGIYYGNTINASNGKGSFTFTVPQNGSATGTGTKGYADGVELHVYGASGDNSTFPPAVTVETSTDGGVKVDMGTVTLSGLDGAYFVDGDGNKLAGSVPASVELPVGTISADDVLGAVLAGAAGAAGIAKDGNTFSGFTLGDTNLTISGTTATAGWTAKSAAAAAQFKDASKSVVYTGSAQSAAVEAAVGVTGLGTPTVHYENTTNTGTDVEPKDVGTYNILVDVTEGATYAAATNINVGTLTITAADITAVSATLSGYVGDTLSNVDVSGITSATGVNSETVAVTAAWANGADTISAGGGNYNLVLTPDAGATNYKATTLSVTVGVKSNEDTTIKLEKAAGGDISGNLTFDPSAANQNVNVKVMQGANDVTGKFDVKVNGEAKTAFDANAAGTYAVTAAVKTGEVGLNNPTDASLTVDAYDVSADAQSALTAAINSAGTVTYNGSEQKLTLSSITTTSGSKSVNVELGYGAVSEVKNAATYTVTLTLASGQSNYKLASDVTASYKINKKTIKLDTVNTTVTKTYDGTTAIGNGTIAENYASGFEPAAADSPVLDLASAVFSSKDVATADKTVTGIALASGEAVNDNYAYTDAAVKGVINRATATVTLDPTKATQSMSTNDFGSFSIEDGITVAGVTADGNLAKTTDYTIAYTKASGDATITVGADGAVTGSGTAGSSFTVNATVTSNNGNYNITDATKVYTVNVTQGYGYAVSFAGDNNTATVGGSATSTIAPSGTGAISISPAEGYKITGVSVSAAGGSLSGTLDDNINSTTGVYTSTYTAPADVPSGSDTDVTITVTTTEIDGFTVTPDSDVTVTVGDSSITAPSLTIGNKTYDYPSSLTYSKKSGPDWMSVAADGTISISAVPATAASGSLVITGTAGNGKTADATVTVTVNKKTVVESGSVTSATKEYDGDATLEASEVTGDLALSDISGAISYSISQATVGSNLDVTASVTLTADEANGYTMPAGWSNGGSGNTYTKTITSVGEITAKALTVTDAGFAAEKTYDGSAAIEADEVTTAITVTGATNSISYSTTATKVSESTATITATVEITDAAAANYTMPADWTAGAGNTYTKDYSGVLTINAADVTTDTASTSVTITTNDSSYDLAASNAITVLGTPALTADDYTISYTSADAGTYGASVAADGKITTASAFTAGSFSVTATIALTNTNEADTNYAFNPASENTITYTVTVSQGYGYNVSGTVGDNATFSITPAGGSAGTTGFVAPGATASITITPSAGYMINNVSDVTVVAGTLSSASINGSTGVYTASYTAATPGSPLTSNVADEVSVTPSAIDDWSIDVTNDSITVTFGDTTMTDPAVSLTAGTYSYPATVTYSLESAPAWMSINPSTGAVTTTDVNAVGSGTVTIKAAAANGTSKTKTFTYAVNKKELTPGVTLNTVNKTYDGKADFTPSAGDGISITGLTAPTITYAYDNANVGKNKTITATITLSTDDKAKYTLGDSWAETAADSGVYTKAVSTAAEITAKALTVNGSVTASKEYDGDATIESSEVTASSIALGGFENGETADSLGVTYGYAFEDETAGNDKNIVITIGGNLGNYTVTGYTFNTPSWSATQTGGGTITKADFEGTAPTITSATDINWDGGAASGKLTVNMGDATSIEISSDNGSTWAAATLNGNDIENLAVGSYKIRGVQDANHNASAASGAQAVKQLYKVTYDVNGGSFESAAPADSVNVAADATVTLPAKDGDWTAPNGKPNFIGWAKAADAASAISDYTVAAADASGNVITLYAVWSDKFTQTTPAIAFGDDSTSKTIKFDEAAPATKVTTTPQDSAAETWASSETTVATVDSDGKITIAGVGTTQITLTYEPTTAYAGATSNAITLIVEKSAAAAAPAVSATTPVSYTGTNDGTATVDGIAAATEFKIQKKNTSGAYDAMSNVSTDASGVISGLEVGAYQIAYPGSATQEDGTWSAEFTIAQQYGVVFDKGANTSGSDTVATLTGIAGEGVTMPAKGTDWASSDNTKPIFSGWASTDGASTAEYAAGAAYTIAAPASGNVITFYPVWVAKTAQNKPAFTLSANSVKLGAEAPTVAETSTALGAPNKVWASSNTDVATIDAATGVITIVGVGSTDITLKYEATDAYLEAVSDAAALTVAKSDGPAKVAAKDIKPVSYNSQTADGAFTIDAAPAPADGTVYNIQKLGTDNTTWTPLADVTVADGKISGLEIGTYQIRVPETATAEAGAWSDYIEIKQQYAVIFDLNTATGSAPAIATGVDGDTVVLPSAGSDWTKADYEFIGWAKTNDAASAIASYAIAAADADAASKTITLYAVWTYLATEAPSEKPTDTPTETPTSTPTDTPTETPTTTPTETPTVTPTETPTVTPTETPAPPLQGVMEFATETGTINIKTSTYKNQVFTIVLKNISENVIEDIDLTLGGENANAFTIDGDARIREIAPGGNAEIYVKVNDGLDMSRVGNKYQFTLTATADGIEDAPVYTGTFARVSSNNSSGGGGGSTQYKVTFAASGGTFADGTASKSVYVAAGGNIKETQIPKIDSESFKYWLVDNEKVDDITGLEVSGNMTVTAVFEGGEPTAAPKPTAEPGSLEHHDAFVKGYPDGNFMPEGNITRAEASAIFARTMADGFVENGSYPANYTDVAASEWYVSYIGYLSNMGIIEGYDDGTFRPDSYITRAEFATMITRFEDVQNADMSALKAAFSDITDGYWANDYIYTAYTSKLIEGYDDGTFRPEANITRAEAVTMVNRKLGRSVDANGLTGADYTSFPDVTANHWAYYQVIEAANDHDYTVGTSPEDWE